MTVTLADILAGPGFTMVAKVASMRGGTLLADDIPVTSAVLDEEDGGPQVIGAGRRTGVPERVTLTVPREKDAYSWDPNGDDTHPLAAAGQQLIILTTYNGEPYQHGVFVIESTTPNGDEMTVIAYGLLYLVKEARLTAPLVPSGNLSDVLRGLIEPAVTVLIDAGLGDRAVPAGLNIDENRLDAVYDLADAWPAELHMDPTGVLRVTRPRSTPGLWLPGVSGSYASTPDAADLDITGDLWVAVDVALVAMASGASQTLLSKWSTTDASYVLFLDSTGHPALAISQDGTTGAPVQATSTVLTGVTDGARCALAAHIDVNNGASGRTVKFYTADTLAGSWTLLDTVTTAGTVSIHSGALPVEVGGHTGGTVTGAIGVFYGAEIRSGDSTGTLVASVDFEHADEDATTTLTDDVSKVWTVHGAAYLVTPRTATYTFSETSPGTAIKATGVSTRKGVYTAVVAQGQTSSGTPVSAVAYRTGDKGYPGSFSPLPVPFVLDSDLITSAGQAQQTASAKMAQLQRDTGRQLTITAVPDPRVKVGDLVSVVSDAYTGDAYVVARKLPLHATNNTPPMVLTVVTV